ncbi:MAG: hypothetical protein LBV60_02515 [Streptomyces sp.]|jgi:opacity protein-like surface antigen|nr:hypothetical protein [Streptomyces sp.]
MIVSQGMKKIAYAALAAAALAVAAPAAAHAAPEPPSTSMSDLTTYTGADEAGQAVLIFTGTQDSLSSFTLSPSDNSESWYALD